MKKFMKFLCVAIVMIFGMGNVNAANVKFVEDRWFHGTGDINFNLAGTYSYGSTYKEALVDGKTKVLAYCFNYQREAPNKGVSLTKRNLTSGETKYKNAFIYILENGYKYDGNGNGVWNRGGNFDNDEKYYITQLAIWGLLGQIGDKDNSGYPKGFELSVLDNKTGHAPKADRKPLILAAAKELVADAIKNNNVSPVSINITPQNSNFVLTSDKKYYQTGEYTVNGKNFSNYSISLSDKDFEIYIPSTGKTISNGDVVSAGTKFVLRISASKNKQASKPTITVSTTGKYKDLEVYEWSGHVDRQDVGMPIYSSKAVKATATATYSPKGGFTVRKIYKDAKGTKIDLKNVAITVTGPNNFKVSWNTNDVNPKSFSDLTPGTYTIHEDSAPAGYQKSKDIQVVVNGNTNENIELVNVKDDDTETTISKQDATTGKELPGAKLVLKDATGNVIDEWTSGSTPHIVVNLKPGVYELSETIAPEGYQKTTETVKFTVNKDGKVSEPVVMKNKPNTSVKISKQDITTSKELPGATLIVKDANGKEVDKWVSTTTPHYLPADLPAGKYTLIEITSPEGYGLSEEVIEFDITDNGVEQTVVMTNSPLPDTADLPFAQIIGGIALALVCGIAVFIKIGKQEA